MAVIIPGHFPGKDQPAETAGLFGGQNLDVLLVADFRQVGRQCGFVVDIQKRSPLGGVLGVQQPSGNGGRHHPGADPQDIPRIYLVFFCIENLLCFALYLFQRNPKPWAKRRFCRRDSIMGI